MSVFDTKFVYEPKHLPSKWKEGVSMEQTFNKRCKSTELVSEYEKIVLIYHM